MNDLIKQLAEQAGLIADQDTKEGWQEYINDVEKFAELIVRECAKKCDEFGDRLEDERPNKDLGVIAYECADGLKRMFGIKE